MLEFLSIPPLYFKHRDRLCLFQYFNSKIWSRMHFTLDGSSSYLNIASILGNKQKRIIWVRKFYFLSQNGKAIEWNDTLVILMQFFKTYPENHSKNRAPEYFRKWNLWENVYSISHSKDSQVVSLISISEFQPVYWKVYVLIVILIPYNFNHFRNTHHLCLGTGKVLFVLNESFSLSHRFIGLKEHWRYKANKYMLCLALHPNRV